MSAGLPVLVEVRRGATVEAKHRGAMVAVDPEGRTVASLGDPSLPTSTRSCIKPLQAMTLITSGAADRFHLTSREIALACASHNGEPLHTFTADRLLARIGLDESALRCGVHRPYSEETAVKLEREGLPFTQLHNNCSGKHAGMLATAAHLGLPITDYVSPDHQIQQAIISTLRRLAGLGETPSIAVDGCSAPTFGVPLNTLALAFARLVNPWSTLQWPDMDSVNREQNIDAQKRIVAAMTAHPEMIGGTKGRFDTDLIRAARGTLIAKIGAEAVYCVGVIPSERYPRGLGVAIKIEDGAKRALEPAVVETLLQLSVLDEHARREIAPYRRPDVINHRGLVVGDVRPVFRIQS
jgi:L-asparaginase II